MWKGRVLQPTALLAIFTWYFFRIRNKRSSISVSRLIAFLRSLFISCSPVVSSQGWILPVCSAVPHTEADLYLVTLPVPYLLWEAEGNQNCEHYSQHKHTVITVDNITMMFSILLSIPPHPGLYYSTYALPADANWADFSMGLSTSTQRTGPCIPRRSSETIFCVKLRLLFFPHKSHFVPVQPEQHLSFYPAVIQHCQVVLQFFTVSPCLYNYRWLHIISIKYHLAINFISMSFINVETSETDAIPAEIHQWTFSTRGRRGCKGHSFLCPVSYLLANLPPIQPHKHFHSTLHVLYLL